MHHAGTRDDGDVRATARGAGEVQSRLLDCSRLEVCRKQEGTAVSAEICMQCTENGTKGNIFPAKGKAVAMLCLGADVELNITPISGFPVTRRNNGTKLVSAPVQASLARMDPDESDSFGSALTSEDEALSTRRVSIAKKLKQSESIFVTLVHGDMLILSGDEYEVRFCYMRACLLSERLY